MATCPDCGRTQEFRDLAMLVKWGTSSCRHCRVEYAANTNKVTIAVLCIIAPMLFAQHIPIFEDEPVLIFFWVIAGIFAFFKFLPLNIVHN